MSSEIYRRSRKENFPSSLELTIGKKTFKFVKEHFLSEGKEFHLRYGDNPHQSSAVYHLAHDIDEVMVGKGLLYDKMFFNDMTWKKMGKDGPSKTNIQDGYNGLNIVSLFKNPAASVMKHLNPCGVAFAKPSEEISKAFEQAWNSDERSSYGGTVCLNRPLNSSTAELFIGKYIECVFAPGCDNEALNILQKKENLRIASSPSLDRLKENPFPFELISVGDGLILQEPYSTGVYDLAVLRTKQVPTKRVPNESEYRDLFYAWQVSGWVRSNGIVIWKKNKAIGIGTGHQDRIGSIEDAIRRAERNQHDLNGSALASDGFLPSVDNIDAIASKGIKSVIQPGGSNQDSNIIKIANENDISMIFTGERSFRHF